MPRVMYTRPATLTKVAVDMQAPTRLADVNAWVKKARKLIPAIPEIGTSAIGWHIVHEDIDAEHIILGLEHKKSGEKAALIFFRRYNTIAGRAV